MARGQQGLEQFEVPPRRCCQLLALQILSLRPSSPALSALPTRSRSRKSRPAWLPPRSPATRAARPAAPRPAAPEPPLTASDASRRRGGAGPVFPILWPLPRGCGRPRALPPSARILSEDDDSALCQSNDKNLLSASLPASRLETFVPPPAVRLGAQSATQVSPAVPFV